MTARVYVLVVYVLAVSAHRIGEPALPRGGHSGKFEKRTSV